MEPACDPFSCLANPIRRSALDLLRLGPLNVEELWTKVAQTKKISRSSFSEHLAVLKDARMVTASSRRTERIYELNPEGFTPVFDWVSHYEAFWNDKLSNLSSYLDRKSNHENS